MVLALAALGSVGRVETWQLAMAVKLEPGLLLGLWISVRLAGSLDPRWLRPAVLGFAGVAGIVIVLRAALGA